MAYYGRGKYTFQKLISECKIDCVKAFLVSKMNCHYDKYAKKKCYIEQWLYNEDADDIRHELNGFVMGFLYGKKPYTDVDIIFAQQELFPILAKIYIEMSSKNNWDSDDNLELWIEYKKMYELR